MSVTAAFGSCRLDSSNFEWQAHQQTAVRLLCLPFQVAAVYLLAFMQCPSFEACFFSDTQMHYHVSCIFASSSMLEAACGAVGNDDSSYFVDMDI